MHPKVSLYCYFRREAKDERGLSLSLQSDKSSEEDDEQSEEEHDDDVLDKAANDLADDFKESLTLREKRELKKPVKATVTKSKNSFEEKERNSSIEKLKEDHRHEKTR